MKKIGILSDTHGYLHPNAFEFFKDCDEIWHAGDIVDDFILDELQAEQPSLENGIKKYYTFDKGLLKIHINDYINFNKKF